MYQQSTPQAPRFFPTDSMRSLQTYFRASDSGKHQRSQRSFPAEFPPCVLLGPNERIHRNASSVKHRLLSFEAFPGETKQRSESHIPPPIQSQAREWLLHSARTSRNLPANLKSKSSLQTCMDARIRIRERPQASGHPPCMI